MAASRVLFYGGHEQFWIARIANHGPIMDVHKVRVISDHGL